MDTASINETTDVIAPSTLACIIQNTLCRKEKEFIYIIKTTE